MHSLINRIDFKRRIEVFLGILKNFFIFVFRNIKAFFAHIFDSLSQAFGPAFVQVYLHLKKVFTPVFHFLKLWVGFAIGFAGVYLRKLFLKIRMSEFVIKKFPLKPNAQKIELALDDLKKELLFLNLFQVLLNSIIVFLIALLICIVFNFGWEWALVPWVIGFGIFNYLYLKNTRFLVVEEKVPELSEKLRTAADNVFKQSEIANDLKDEVVHDMRKVSTKLFFDVDTVAVRLFSVVIIAFIIVILAFLDLTFDFQFAPVVNTPVTYLRERIFAQDPGANASLAFTQGDLSAVFGNKTELVKLGDEKLSLEVNPLQSEMDFQDVRDAENKNFNPPVYPKEIYTSYDTSYTETIAKKNQAVVKSYFEQISQ